MPYKQIGEYGVIGDGATLALIGRDGALDWMCLPFMDSPSVFATILDDGKGGRFSISPDGERLLESTRGYWRSWVLQSETWSARRDSFWQEPLDRAALVLKLLQVTKTSASTTSTASCSTRCSPCPASSARSASSTGRCCSRCSTR